MMIIDITGTILIPGNRGKDCPGNGQHCDDSGIPIECCCDECDYLMCCYTSITDQECLHCTDSHCPHAGKH